MARGVRPVVLWIGVYLVLVCWVRGEEGKVLNGSFESTRSGARELEGWGISGDKGVVQELCVEREPARGQVARLRCTRFVPGTSASHAMIAQYGHVGVQKGRWYRLSLWARAADLVAGAVQAGLSNTRDWSTVGLSGSFVPSDRWQRYGFVFMAEEDLKPAESRLAIYFFSTGTLWLDDVVLEETTKPKREWLPAVRLKDTGNALANSSFETAEGWGSSAGRYFHWTANVFQRVGQWDESQAFHGKRSWKVTLSATRPLWIYGGYAHLAAKVDSLELGHAGWIRVKPGMPCVFSVYVKSDGADVPVSVSLKEPEDAGSSHQRVYRIGRQWQRVEVSYAPKGEFVRGCIGFALREGDHKERTLWLDAAQLERGESASTYHPRSECEAGIETGITGNLFHDPATGLRYRLRAFNDAQVARRLRGRLSVSDFWGKTAWEARVDLEVGPGQAAERFYQVLAGRCGFFRIHWEPDGGDGQSLRAAVIQRSDEEDAIFGFNHALGQDFLVPLAQQAGMRWWRDWSAQWDTVQPRRDDALDFRQPDIQIQRVVDQGGQLVVLLPSPSASWAAATDPKVLQTLRERQRKGSISEEGVRQAIVAMKPARLEDFAEYVRSTVRHFKGRVSHYEILNEPLYTQYALPSVGCGYRMSDYLDMLRTAYRVAKETDPGCTVIGGVACDPGSPWVRQFVEQGGLAWCDAMNYHLYPGRERAETLESAFRMRWAEMEKRGVAKPIWVTELGLYAEDDPASTPLRAGDSTLDGALRPDEQTASQDLVELTTVMMANGVRKIFFHGGFCEGYHASSTANMFFEYGGAPRKMYPAVATMARLLGPDFQFVRKWDKPQGLHAYEFRSRGRTVVVLWSRKVDAGKLEVPQGFRALDLMGNLLEGGGVIPGNSPIYLVSK